MIKELLPGLRITLVFTLLTGLLYPAVLTGISQAVFPHQANGSLVLRDGRVIGSSLIGQSFTRPEYFHPRPSSAGSGYDATASGGSNLGPTSARLLHGATKAGDKGSEAVDFDGIADRIVHYSIENNIAYTSSRPIDQFTDAQRNLDDVNLIKAFNDPKTPLVFTPSVPIPSDAVTASASGLDPHISPANARLQTARVAAARHISDAQVLSLVAKATERPTLGFIGEPRVNVLLLNLSLDQMASRPR